MTLYDKVVSILTSPEYVDELAKGIVIGIQILGTFLWLAVIFSMIFAIIAIVWKFKDYYEMRCKWKRMSMDELIERRNQLKDNEYWARD